MICPICSKENWATARFCQECGTFILGRCPQCRHEIPATARFCIHCGIALLSQEHNKTGAVTDDLSLHTVKSSAQAQPLQQYMPDELAIKLDSARSNQTMVGERRVVTMLFCDVKGSTAAAEQLDPEEWTEIMNGAFEQMIRPVYQYEGTIASLMGDAILAFFGAPIAHEDDPQRAVLAGLAIAEGINPYRAEIQKRWGIDIDVRVGINTGLVVAGGVGSDMKMEYTALGDAVNVAARMEQTAEPGTVHVSEDTYKLIAPLFEFEDLGLTEVKGKKDPLPTYRVIGRKLRAGRLRGIEGLQAPLIGRQIEWKQLNEALESLAKGIGQIAILNGEAGLGKSRLISELRLEAASVDSSIEWFETTCFSYESTQPYGLFQRLARRVVGAGLNDSPEVLRAKLEEAVAETVIDLTPTYRTQIFQMFETLFGLPGQDDLPPLQGESFKGMLYSLMTELWQHR
ncbi:MAG: AAA family ATPase, partial [Proteobacteria bacterium]|nr:AAA family ATPase [Pseudomonadota bacterium]